MTHKLLKAPDRETLQGMTFSEMDKQGNYLSYCKTTYPDLYNSKFKEHFGYLPGAKPKQGMGNKKELEIDAALINKMNGMTWDELEKADLLGALKNLPAMYQEKFNQKFRKPTGRK
jgi:hypothetical protein